MNHKRGRECDQIGALMNTYLITFSSGNPEWQHSKWRITTESRHEALHKANLMHDDALGWDINMVTLSKSGTTDAHDDDFWNLDAKVMESHILFLERIWNQKFNKLENC